jgi:hypothetical protein
MKKYMFPVHLGRTSGLLLLSPWALSVLRYYITWFRIPEDGNVQKTENAKYITPLN